MSHSIKKNIKGIFKFIADYEVFYMEEIAGQVRGGQKIENGIELVMYGQIKKEGRVWGKAKAKVVLQVVGDGVTEIAKHYHKSSLNELGTALIGKEFIIKFSD